MEDFLDFAAFFHLGSTENYAIIGKKQMWKLQSSLAHYDPSYVSQTLFSLKHCREPFYTQQKQKGA